MPDPTQIQCPEGVWTIVGTDQIFWYIQKMDNRPTKYLFTYRMTGNAAPTAQTEGVPIFMSDEKKLIFALDGIDVYVMALGADGRVRYDWTW
jgi:hypothetical protein